MWIIIFTFFVPSKSYSDSFKAYTSPVFGWTIQYPSNWTLNDSDPTAVMITSPLRRAFIGIHTNDVRAKTLDELVDFIILYTKRQLYEAKNINYVVVSRKKIQIDKNTIGIDVLSELRPGGKSRRLYFLVENRAFGVDAETYAEEWDQFVSQFDRILRTFRLPQKN